MKRAKRSTNTRRKKKMMLQQRRRGRKKKRSHAVRRQRWTNWRTFWAEERRLKEMTEIMKNYNVPDLTRRRRCRTPVRLLTGSVWKP